RRNMFSTLNDAMRMWSTSPFEWRDRYSPPAQATRQRLRRRRRRQALSAARPICDSACGSLLLLAGVSQIIEIDGLAVAVDPRANQAKAVEAGADSLVSLRQSKLNGLVPERNGNLTSASGGRWRIFQRPVVHGSIRADARRLVRSLAAAIAPDAICRSKIEPFTTWSVCRYAQETPRQSTVLGGIDGHAVLGMKEANQHRAVGDTASQAHLSRSPQWLVQRQLVKPVGVTGHLRRKAAVAAENHAAQCPDPVAPGMSGGALAEIEARPHKLRNVGPAIWQLFPARVAAEILLVPIDGDVV